MKLTMVSGTSLAYTANAYQVTGGEWDPTTIQWTNKPAANILLESNISNNDRTKYQFSVLTAVQHWYDGDPTGQNENYGIMLRYYDETLTGYYNSVYSGDVVDTNSRPKLTISYTISGGSYSVLEGGTLTLPLTRAGGTVTWTSSDTSVAIVNSNGIVTGINAGKVTITAAIDGTEHQKYTVYTIIHNGVYRLRINAGLYLGTYGGTTENTSVKLLAYSNDNLSKINQLWKITYLGSGYYSIRPMHKLNMGLHAGGTVGSSVDIVSVGMNDSLSEVALINRWGIERSADGSGYYLNHVGTSSLGLKMDGYVPSVGANVTIAQNPGTEAFEWSLQQVTDLFLHDSDGDLVTASAHAKAEVEMGGTYTLAQMGLHLTTSNVTPSWSTNGSVASVNALGKVTANKRGVAEITVSATVGNTTTSFVIDVTSIETIYVKNYYDKTISGDTEIINGIYSAVSFLNLVFYEEFNLRFMMSGAPIQHMGAPVNVCDHGNSQGCEAGENYNCSDIPMYHHKNIYKISEDICPSSDNQIVVMWSNCKNGIFCEDIPVPDDPAASQHKLIDNTIIAETVGEILIYSDGSKELNFDPVVQFLTINNNPYIYRQGLSDSEFMSIILAHEVVHTLGMGDVYNYKFYEDAEHCYSFSSEENIVDCIMETLSCMDAQSLYASILEGNSGLCSDCLDRLHDEIADDVYEN